MLASEANSKRKFGNHDFERFDHLPSQQASVGSRDLGKIKIDCRLRCDKSQWGVIGQKPAPAGIIYLDLNFHQPQNSRLKHATVIVTLDNIDGDNLQQGSHEHEREPRDEGVQLHEWFGPRHLVGQPRNFMSMKESSILPQIDVGGIAGLGGVGKRSEELFVQESRWMFSGHLVSDKSTLTYKTIQWDLVENALESQPLHSNVIHTAFSFRHNERPFIMRIEIRGRLKGRNDRTKQTLKKFSSWLARDGSYTTTCITPSGPDRFTKPLDELARGLPLAMEKENFEEAPIVVPSPREVVFGDWMGDAAEVTPEERYRTPGETRRINPSGATDQKDWLISQADCSIQDMPSLLDNPLKQKTDSDAWTDPTLPTVDNLAMAFDTLNMPRKPILNRQPRENMEFSRVEEASQDGLTTVVDQDLNTERDDSTDPASSKRLGKNIEDTEAVLALLRMSGLLSVIQVLAAILASFGIRLESRTAVENRREVDNKSRESRELAAEYRK